MNLKNYFEDKIKSQNYSSILEIRKKPTLISKSFGENTLTLRKNLIKFRSLIVNQTKKIFEQKKMNKKNLEEFENFITYIKKRKC
jgi:hypothetical protein